jgi:hypothetical protein
MEHLIQQRKSGWFARWRELASPICVWTVWAAMTAAAILFVRYYSRNIPYVDDLALVPMMTGHQPVNLQWLWSLHNEHRPVVSRLIMAGLYRLISPDFRLGMYVNAGLLSAAAASMLVAVRRLRGHTSVMDVVLPMSILSLGQAETLMISFAMNLTLTTWISCLLIALASRSTGRPGWRLTVTLGLLLVLLPLCGGSGLVMLPPLVLWLAYRIRCCGSGRAAVTSEQKIGLLFLIACLAVAAVYMVGYGMPAGHRPPPSFAAVLSTLLGYLSLVFCPSDHTHWFLAGLAAASLLAATFVRLGWVALRQPADRLRAVALSSVLLAMFCAAAAVGVTRSFIGAPWGGIAGRYVTTTAPLFAALYVAWLVSGPALARRVVHLTLLAAVALSLTPNIRSSVLFGDERLVSYRKIERCLKTHPRVSKAVEIACPTLHPSPEFVRQSLVMLKNAQVGAFRNLVDDRVAAVPDSSTSTR